MKILHVISSLTRGGAEMMVSTCIEKMHKLGHDVSVCCLRDKGELYERLERIGVRCHFHQFRSRLSPVSLWWLARLIRRERIDVLHTHMYRANTSATVASLLTNIKANIATVHSEKIWDNDHQRRMEARLNRFRDYVIAVSSSSQDKFIKGTGIEPERCLYIPNGVDTERFQPREANPELRVSLGLSPDDIVIGMIARFAEAKDHETFLKTAYKLTKYNDNVRFLLVGDGRTRSSMENLAKELFGNDSPVIFTGERADVPDLLALMTVKVLSTHWEGMPISVLEAMAAGVPVITNPVGGIQEIIKDGETGMLYRAGDADNLLKKLRILLDGTELLEHLRKNARDYVVKHYSLDSIVEKWLNVYDRAGGRKK